MGPFLAENVYIHGSGYITVQCSTVQKSTALHHTLYSDITFGILPHGGEMGKIGPPKMHVFNKDT